MQNRYYLIYAAYLQFLFLTLQHVSQLTCLRIERLRSHSVIISALDALLQTVVRMAQIPLLVQAVPFHFATSQQVFKALRFVVVLRPHHFRFEFLFFENQLALERFLLLLVFSLELLPALSVIEFEGAGTGKTRRELSSSVIFVRFPYLKFFVLVFLYSKVSC